MICQKAISLEVLTNVTPCDLSVVDNTVFGPVTMSDMTPGPTQTVAFGTFDPMQFDFEYVNGHWSYEVIVGGGCGLPGLVYTNMGLAIYYNVVGPAFLHSHVTQVGADQPDTQALPGCPPNVIDWTQIVGNTQAGITHTGGAVQLRFDGNSGYGVLTEHNGTPNPTWQIRRTLKTLYSPPAHLRVDAATYPFLAATLVPRPGAGPGGALPVWLGELPTFATALVGSDWFWNGYSSQMFTRAFTMLRLRHTFVGALSPSGCAWLCYFGYSSGRPWVGMGGGGGIGGGGIYPYGRFYFRTDIPGWAVAGQYADVRLATTGPLPANTRVGNVITANAVGSLPSIDGVAPAVGNRILLKNEVLTANNGVYTVTNLGSPVDFFVLTRSTDMDISAEVTQGLWVEITAGSTLGNTYWRLITLDPIVLNTTGLNWFQVPPYIDIEAY